MAQITVKGTKVIFEGVTINNRKIADALDKIEGGKRVEFIVRAMEVYLFAIDISGEGAKIELLGDKVKQHTNTMMENVGNVKKLMMQDMEESEKRVKNNLDQSDEMLRKFLAEAMERLSLFGKRESERKRTTKAGYKYEEFIADMIRDIASSADAPFRRVGATTAKESKKGDCVVEFEEGKVVFEIKDRQKMSHNYIMEEISKAVKNHDAQFGVFVARDVTDLPDIDTIGTLGEQYMACGTEENGTAIPGILKMICVMARIKMASKKSPTATINNVEVGRLCNDAKRNMMQAFKKCSDIESATASLKSTLLKNVDQSLDDILKLVKEKTNSESLPTGRGHDENNV